MKRKILALTACVLLLGLLTGTVKGDINFGELYDWDLTFGANPQYAFIDSTVTHEGSSSIRIGVDAVGGREVDLTTPIQVNVGDIVYFSMYIKTNSSSGGLDGNHWFGGRIGIDFYSAENAILASQPTDGNSYDNWVPFGTTDWVLKTWNVTVPSTYYSYDMVNQELSPAQRISYIIPWLMVSPYEDTGVGWFADAQIYINPSTTVIQNLPPDGGSVFSPVTQETNESYQSYTSWGGSTTIAVIGVVGGLMLFIFRWGTHSIKD